VAEKVVQPVSWMPQRHRPTSHAAKRSGKAAMIALTEKCVAG
jgi:hypothetical protein